MNYFFFAGSKKKVILCIIKKHSKLWSIVSIKGKTVPVTGRAFTITPHPQDSTEMPFFKE
jgi:hypothetical protein